MKTTKKILLLPLLGLISLPAYSNPCAYMAPVVYAGAITGYYQGLEMNASMCLKNQYNSKACTHIEDVYHVDLNKYFNDTEYNLYINNLSHDPIRKASSMAIKSVDLMLSELEGSLYDAAIEESIKLSKLGKNVTKDALSKSFSRFISLGLCQ